MKNSFWNYVGLNGGPQKQDDKHAVRALPAAWYTSPEMYELERRAIFSKKWLLTTHKSRLSASGQWVRYEIAGFDIILSRDREGRIYAFHNVCRHRAFPIVSSNQGKSSIFSCKYHGWSYGLNGKLAKAPGFHELDGFDKNQNGLFEVHIHTDEQGFMWINLDASKEPEIVWNDDFAGIDKQERYDQYNFDDYDYDHSWEMEGGYNWKLCADNYNECYHCPTSHPDIVAVADLGAYYVETKNGAVQHFPQPRPDQIAAGLNVAPTFFFPNASLNVSPHIFFIQRFIPSGPKSTKMCYEVYRNRNSSAADFGLINEVYKRIMSEDKELCDGSQKNMERGVFVNGEMHPRLEKGPLHFQRQVRDLVRLHHEREESSKREIWPAQQTVTETGGETTADLQLCAAIESCASRRDSAILAW